VLDRPVDRDPTGGVQRVMPRLQQLDLLGRGRDVDIRRRMLGQPPAQLVAELLGAAGRSVW
jgi:hypothetical protein